MNNKKFDFKYPHPSLGLTRWDFENKMVTYQFVELEYTQYLMDSTKSIQEHIVERDAYIEDEMYEYDEEFEIAWHEDFQRKYDEINVTHHNILQNSIFLQSYFTFEDTLFRYCKTLEEKNKCKIKVKDINGQGIEQYKKYLTKVFNLDEIFTSDEWNKIQVYNYIRNILVHNGGIAPNQKIKELQQKMFIINRKNKSKQVGVDKENYLSIKNIGAIINVFETFFDKLNKEIYDKKAFESN